MRILATLLIAALLPGCSPAAHAQEDTPPVSEPQAGGAEGQGDNQGQEQPGPDDEAKGSKPEPDAAPSLTIDDARVNFTTVVENFITAHSPQGYWALKQKSTGKVLKLRLEKVDPKSVKPTSRGRYSGKAVLLQVDSDERVRAEFLVSLIDQWKVESMRLLPGVIKAKKTKAPKKPAAADASDGNQGKP